MSSSAPILLLSVMTLGGLGERSGIFKPRKGNQQITQVQHHITMYYGINYSRILFGVYITIRCKCSFKSTNSIKLGSPFLLQTFTFINDIDLLAKSYRPVARIRITPVTLHGGVRKSRAGGPPLWRIVLTCDIRRHLGHLPGRVSAIEGVCRSVFGTVQHTVRHKRAEPSFVKKLAINTASVHFAIDKIRVVLQAWALIIRILYVTLLMTSRAMGLYLQGQGKGPLVSQCGRLEHPGRAVPPCRSKPR